MPNARNVDAPVTLVGPGRSGTTLVTQIFRRHPDFFAVGESVDLVWSTYRQLDRHLRNTGRFPGDRSLAETKRDGVHGLLCGTYPSPERFWFHKPIFVPSVSRGFASPEEFRAWFWQAADEIFPRGRFLTVLREPADNAASIMVRWNNSEAQAFARLEECYRLMLHADSRVGLVLPFEELQDRPEDSTRRLLAFAGAPYDAACLAPFSRAQAPNPDAPRPTGLVVPPVVRELYERLLAGAEPTRAGRG